MSNPSMLSRLFALVSILVLQALPVWAHPAGGSTSSWLRAKRLAWVDHQQMASSSIVKGLPWRCVGPAEQGGRLVDIEVTKDSPYTFYVAYASGGIWRTEDFGQSFEPLFDDQPCAIIGDLALDPSDANRLWVGTGENNSSRSSYGGMGVFRSDDAGESWCLMGLEESDRIGRILVDPRNSNRVFVASLGKLYTEGGERGIYRTEDGGETWQQVLKGDARTGFVDLVFQPDNPDVLYAAAWERIRRPWDFVEGGPGSGIYKSSDGGETWTRLTGGFPRGDHVGRIGLAVSPAKPNTIYAMLDNQKVLPEEEWDLGASPITPKRLRTMTRDEFLKQDKDDIESFLNRYNLDPELDAKILVEKIEKGEISLADLVQACMDANTSLFESDIRGVEVYRSDDAGTTFQRTHEDSLRDLAFTYAYYFGQIRVSPTDENRIYILGVPLLTSEDGGMTFEGRNAPNMHVDHQSLWIDPDFPDRLLIGNDGGLYLSHNGGRSWIKLNSLPVGQFYTVEVDMADPYNVYGGLQDNGVLKGSSTWRSGDSPWERIGGGDGMYVQVDPRDNRTTYLGSQFGNYSRIGSGKRQRVKPVTSLKERALRFNWCTPIQLSPHSADILYFGANRLFRSLDQGETLLPISPDLTTSEERGNVPFGTITTVAESRLEFGLIWVGTDDGNVHVTQDGGRSWRRVSDALPEDRWVTRVEPSRHESKVAYVSFSGYRDDDVTSYLYRTADLGTSWTSISDGLPHEPINVVREDPQTANLLYVGTDRGAYLSWDRGGEWISISGGLPKVPIHDLVVHPRERELVAATHGRSVWILDVLPIQDLDDEVRDRSVYVYPVADIDARRGWKRRPRPWWNRPGRESKERYTYWAKKGGEGEFALLDEDGRVLLREQLIVVAGLNVFDWDYKVDLALALPAEKERLIAAREKEKEGKEKEGKDEEAKKDENSAKKDEEPEVTTLEGDEGDEGEEGEEGDEEIGPLARGQEFDYIRFATPGTYEIRISVGDDEHSRELEIKAPKPMKSRLKKKPKVRDKASRPLVPPAVEAAAESFPEEEIDG